MKTGHKQCNLRATLLLCTLTARCLLADQGTNGQIVSARDFTKSPNLTFTTAAYQTEALRLLVREANLVASELQLPENLPITETNVIAKFVNPYGAAQFLQAIGNISTSNYVYFVSKDYKFSYLEWQYQEQAPRLWAKDYCWPINRLDTNAAYQLATQWLTAASMDVSGLNRDCDLGITPSIVKGKGTNALFLPIYWIYWTRGGLGHGSVALVELFLPNRTLMQMRVTDPKYIRRKPLTFGSIEGLLSKP